jgi:hypothetical protein
MNVFHLGNEVKGIQCAYALKCCVLTLEFSICFIFKECIIVKLVLVCISLSIAWSLHCLIVTISTSNENFFFCMDLWNE